MVTPLSEVTTWFGTVRSQLPPAYKFESLGCNLFSYVKGSSFSVRGMPLIPLLNALRELGIISLK